MSADPTLAAATAPRLARRHVVVALSFLACILAYTDRVNLSVAAVAMQEQLGWTQTEKGFVLSAFFAGYLLFMLASGWLAARFGGRRTLAVAVIAWSVFTLLTPPAATMSFAALILVRLGMGIGEAGMFPAAMQIFSRWVPAGERSRAVAQLLSGIPIGTVAGLMITGWIVGRFDWPMAFYSFGLLGLVWAVVWYWQVREDPASDPRVTPAERTVLPVIGATPGGRLVVPWRRILGSTPVWAMVVAHFTSNWMLYVLLAWLPSYFREVQGLSIANAGLFSAAPWLAMFAVTNVAAPIADRMIGRGVSVTRTRKIMQCIGLLGPAACLFAMQYAATSTEALLLLCGATGLLGFVWAGYAPNSLDLSPRHSAVIMGFSNTFATVPGVVGVAVTGWLVDLTGTYTAAFVLAAALAVVGAAVYTLFFEVRSLDEPAGS